MDKLSMIDRIMLFASREGFSQSHLFDLRADLHRKTDAYLRDVLKRIAADQRYNLH